ncbi:hypothetical protein BAE44_0007754 [Dichanthelium oligosanthes]|uniref:Protein kinase domain-containing protein n=1 Tax=Dichanthelium oligosanthes TaxID=888268 RepID=A0A1E5W1K0_9POAL|nr:hypothetical protein BAE44_0007754 [Dichanthelium oligosanthes]
MDYSLAMEYVGRASRTSSAAAAGSSRRPTCAASCGRCWPAPRRCTRAALSTGISRPTTSSSATLAPLENADHGALVDSWSLGCVMAELLTGELLFSGEEVEDQVYEIFDVLGVPDEQAWQAMKPRVLVDEVEQWRARQRQA